MCDEVSAHMRPQLSLRNRRLVRLWEDTWQRLPDEAKTVLSQIMYAVSEVEQWDEATKDSLQTLGIERGYGRWRTLTREIQLCKQDCDSTSDDVVIGVLAHELAHAYQTARTPNDSLAIEEAASKLPREWGFDREIIAAQEQVAKDKDT